MDLAQKIIYEMGGATGTILFSLATGWIYCANEWPRAGDYGILLPPVLAVRMFLFGCLTETEWTTPRVFILTGERLAFLLEFPVCTWLSPTSTKGELFYIGDLLMILALLAMILEISMKR